MLRGSSTAGRDVCSQSDEVAVAAREKVPEVRLVHERQYRHNINLEHYVLEFMIGISIFIAKRGCEYQANY